MIRILRWAPILLGLMVVSTAAQSTLAGWWAGKPQGLPLRLELHISGHAGAWHAVMISVDQGGAKLPASSVALTGARLDVEFAAIGGAYQGTVQPGALEGTWSQGGRSWPLLLRRTTAPATTAVTLLQRPQPPFPYKSVNVTVPSAGGIQLAGTLTVPEGRGPFPAAVLIAGSGPNNRNETVFGHNVFWVLADALSRHGLAVLRMDKRGVGQSGGNAATATMAAYAADTEAGIEFLRRQPEIDARKIGLIGHSEGGAIAPMVAARHPGQVAFVVMLAGPAIPGGALIVAQVEALNRAAGASAAEAAENGQIEAAFVRAVLTAPDPADVRASVEAAVKAGKLPASILAKVPVPFPSELYSLYQFDPAPYLRQLRCPVLALDGSKDTQVPAAVNIPALRSELANDPRATIVEAPGLNHLFQPAKTGAVSEYASSPITFAPAALDRIESWLAGVVGTQAPTPPAPGPQP